MSQDVSKRVALVTGASRGLGAAIARALAQRGAKVAVNYLGSPAKAESVVAEIARGGGTAAAFQADVRDEAAVAAMVDQVHSRVGPIDVLVCNATGPQPNVRLEDLTWRDCLDQLEF